MKISIITTCFNREKTIGEALSSVLLQDYDNLESIIVDGASNDKSVNVIESTLKELGFTKEGTEGNVQLYVNGTKNVKFLSEPDNGMYEALNKGIRLSSGDMIGVCHSDDILFSSDTVTKVVKHIQKENADFLYADGLYVDSTNLDVTIRRWISGQYSRWKVLHGWLPLHTTCYISKHLFERLGMYNEQYRIASDTDFLVHYLNRNDIRVKYLHEFVTCMRMGGLSTNKNHMKKMWKEDVNIYKQHGFMFPTITKIEKMMWKVPQFVMAKLKGSNFQ